MRGSLLWFVVPVTGHNSSSEPSDRVARSVAPPQVLAARVAAEVEAIAVAGDGQDDTSTYLAAGEALFARLLRDGCTSRASAVDLLVVDALVTYAFELDESAPAVIEARAERAMTRVGRLVA